MKIKCPECEHWFNYEHRIRYCHFGNCRTKANDMKRINATYRETFTQILEKFVFTQNVGTLFSVKEVKENFVEITQWTKGDLIKDILDSLVCLGYIKKTKRGGTIEDGRANEYEILIANPSGQINKCPYLKATIYKKKMTLGCEHKFTFEQGSVLLTRGKPGDINDR